MNLAAMIARNHRSAPPTAANITRIAAGYKVNTSGAFDRNTTIPDLGPIPAGALIVVKAGHFDELSISDTAGNTYVPGTDGTASSYRLDTMEYHCLNAIESEVNELDLTIGLGGGGVEAYMIAVEVYTGTGTWQYLAAQSGVTQQSYDTGDTEPSAPVTTSAGGVATGIVVNDNDLGDFKQFTPGEVLVAHGMMNQAAPNADAMSGAYIFDDPLAAQVFSAGVGVSGAYKYLDFNLSVFVNGANP